MNIMQFLGQNQMIATMGISLAVGLGLGIVTANYKRLCMLFAIFLIKKAGKDNAKKIADEIVLIANEIHGDVEKESTTTTTTATASQSVTTTETTTAAPVEGQK